MSMRTKQSLVVHAALLAAVSLMIAACGGDSKNGGGQVTQARATASPSPSPADPLGGEWRTEFSCRQSLHAVEHRLSDQEIHKQVGSLKSFLEVWGGKPTKNDPCHGATGSTALLVRFADGNLALLDAETGEVGAQARYRVIDDHTVRVDDKEGNLCDAARGCPVTWQFQITGDKLTFRVSPDAYVLGAWEAAPFHRVS